MENEMVSKSEEALKLIKEIHDGLYVNKIQRKMETEQVEKLKVNLLRIVAFTDVLERWVWQNAK